MKLPETEETLKARLKESRKSLAIIYERYNSEIHDLRCAVNEHFFESERMKVEWEKMKNQLTKTEKEMQKLRSDNYKLQSDLDKSKNLIVCRECATILGEIREKEEEYED